MIEEIRELLFADDNYEKSGSALLHALLCLLYHNNVGFTHSLGQAAAMTHLRKEYSELTEIGSQLSQLSDKMMADTP